MIVYAVDLGTTNVKVVRYDDTARARATASSPMRYHREGDRVTFDPDTVVDTVLDLVRAAGREAPETESSASIVLTGQAESLVLVDAQGQVVGPGISWMDERSGDQAGEMAAAFDPDAAFAITGEPEAVPTWPATKLRWLAQHHPEVLPRVRHVFMIKDFVIWRLTGRAVGEETTRGFTYLYDVSRRDYWPDMLDFCGVTQGMMPEVVPAGATVGPVVPRISERLPAASYTVNTGALDHFCAMLGTDTYAPGQLSVSAGTVLALSMLADGWTHDPTFRVSFHAGLRPDDTVLFSCADSGGVCLGWLQEILGADGDLGAVEPQLREVDRGAAPLFLPYLTGLNPPDFNPRARGAFLDLQLRHQRSDLVYSVMEGVAHLLRRNLADLADHGHAAASLTSAGGGTASGFWNQLKADVTGLELTVPQEPQDACRGAAILALAAEGAIGSLGDTASLSRPPVATFYPRHDPRTDHRYAAFDGALHRLYGS
ncbi:FGGY family carbohydrate kinase [uncultured Serinicoccus sp.]|uniref:xylulokinase n=1 Tax=uncultured Serinicoccus sp. TaxID=735514 RepID=UPI002607DF7F|nr:FGGY family carbohydrate kinase [uncultured Serinicoccus sp.]